LLIIEMYGEPQNCKRKVEEAISQRKPYLSPLIWVNLALRRLLAGHPQCDFAYGLKPIVGARIIGAIGTTPVRNATLAFRAAALSEEVYDGSTLEAYGSSISGDAGSSRGIFVPIFARASTCRRRRCVDGRARH